MIDGGILVVFFDFFEFGRDVFDRTVDLA